MSPFHRQKTTDSVFGAMLSMAEPYLKTVPHKINLYQLCLVLSTAQGEQMRYSIDSDSIEGLINQGNTILLELQKQEKTEIKKIVCMWENKEIDTPSIQFMKRLCERNTDNRNAKILMNAGTEAYVTKKIAEIIG